MKQLDSSLSPEVNKDLATDYFREFWQTDTVNVAMEDCEEGYLYYGHSSSIGEVAICRGMAANGTIIFEGNTRTNDKDHLFTEYYSDKGDLFTSWWPIDRWKKAPEFANKLQTMSWLLDANIELLETRLEWLLGMPKCLKESPDFPGLLDDTSTFLDFYRSKRQNGFDLESKKVAGRPAVFPSWREEYVVKVSNQSGV